MKLLPPALLLAPLLAGCAPQGWLRTQHGSDRIRTAFHLTTALYGAPARVVILSNSHFPCALPSQPDPDAITAAERDYYLAWNREGSVVLAFVLFSWDTSSWAGSYPVDEAASPYGLDEIEPRAAMAGYRAVWEAEVSEEDGLYREYQPVVEEEIIPVEAPGTIDVEESDDVLSGSFSLDSLDVSGRFTTQRCASGSGDLLDYLDLFSSGLPSDTRDSGGVYFEGGGP